MPKFSCVVKDKEGKAYKYVVDAPTQKEIVEKLQKQEYFIVSIKEIVSASSTSPASKQQPAIEKKSQIQFKNKRKFSHNKTKLADLLVFARQLATMLESGVTLTRSLDVIQSQIQSKQFFNVVVQVKKDVEQGLSLSQSLAKHPKVFNQFWISLSEVGEASGTIPIVLNKLTFYLEQQSSFKATIISGVLYPIILFTVSMGAVVFFALFVGPRFESIFSSMNVALPLITIVLLATFKFIKSNLIIIVGVLAGIIFFLGQYIKTSSGRIAFERFLFNLPTAGEIFKLIIVERFSSQMAILLDAGVPILYALDISERLVDNKICSQIVNNIKEDVRKGELLVSPMEKSGFFPPMCIQMIMVGEETGELSKMLKHVAKFYQTEVETFMKRFATIIEPFMLVFMGFVIGTIVLAMFLPLFNIAQLGGGTGAGPAPQ